MNSLYLMIQPSLFLFKEVTLFSFFDDLFHRHKYEIIESGNLVATDYSVWNHAKVVVGKYYIMKCSVCGKITSTKERFNSL